jgi:hypothetical protein
MSFVEIDESPTREETASGDDTWLPHFWTIRDFALALVRNRVYPALAAPVFGRSVQ